MRIRNGHVIDLTNVLFNLDLSGKESRMRSRFRKLLIEYQSRVIDFERQQLIEEFAVRDEQGEIIYVSENQVSIKEDFYKNYNELLNEYFIVENNETNKDMLITVSNIMLNTDYKFSGELADLYDIWCEEFESLIDYYNKEEV